PSRHMNKMFCLGWWAAVVSPAIAPFSTRQKSGSQSQPLRLWPSKIGRKPVSSRGGIGLPRPPVRAGCWAKAVIEKAKTTQPEMAVPRVIRNIALPPAYLNPASLGGRFQHRVGDVFGH